MAPYAKKSTLLMIASTRSGIMVFMQKVARTAAEAPHPTISTQNFISVPLRALISSQSPMPVDRVALAGDEPTVVGDYAQRRSFAFRSISPTSQQVVACSLRFPLLNTCTSLLPAAKKDQGRSRWQDYARTGPANAPAPHRRASRVLERTHI